MASAGNEAELDPRARVANRKELFVAVFIDNDGRELAAGCLQGGVGVAGIQDLDSDVVNPAAVFGEVLSDIGASFGSDQNQGDPACGDRGDARGLVGWRSRMKPELLGQRSGGLSQVGDGNDDMVNTAETVSMAERMPSGEAVFSGGPSARRPAISMRWVSLSTTRMMSSAKSGSMP